MGFGFAQAFLRAAGLVEVLAHACDVETELNTKRIREHLGNCLTLVTTLNPHIGHEKAAVTEPDRLSAPDCMREARCSGSGFLGRRHVGAGRNIRSREPTDYLQSGVQPGRGRIWTVFGSIVQHDRNGEMREISKYETNGYHNQLRS